MHLDGPSVAPGSLPAGAPRSAAGIGIFGRRDPKKNTIIGTLVNRVTTLVTRWCGISESAAIGDCRSSLFTSGLVMKNCTTSS